MSDYLDYFREAIIGAGLTPPDEIVPNGKLHRFSSTGKRGDDSGWYVLHGDGGIPAGSFGDWRTGLSETWRHNIGRPLTPGEVAEHKARIEAARRLRDEEDQRRKAEAREQASLILAESGPCDGHPYLTRKGVKAVPGLKLHRDGRLIVPMRDSSGKLHSIQTIDDGGDKRFLPGGRVKACYFSIGKPNGELCIAEGLATGLSIHEATGKAVAVAFNAGNLVDVAKALHTKYPDLRLTVCADDDYLTPGNPGITKATEAARAVGGLLAVPIFGNDRPEKATDFNDLAQLQGAEAVRRCLEAAKPVGDADPQAAKETPPEARYASEVRLIRGSEIKPEPIRWLWENWIASGKTHIFGGAPGVGKSTIALAIAATLTIGGQWPDGARARPGNVVIWSGEDDPKDTLVPRLIASGADMQHVFFVDSVFAEAEGRRSFDPSRDMDALRRTLLATGNVRLLIVDPIVSAISGDSHKNAEVRRGLQPLADLAEELDCALLGITHFSKGTKGNDPVERLNGSLAFGALARIVMVAAKHQEQGEDGKTSRLFCRAKSNIGPDGDGFHYDLHQDALPDHPGVFASSVLWGEAVEGTARELLGMADATDEGGDGGGTKAARRFLEAALSAGTVAAKRLIEEAKDEGINERTLQRAAKKMGVIQEKTGMRGGWFWRLSGNFPEGDKSPPEDDTFQAENPEDAEGDTKESLTSSVAFVSAEDDNLHEDDRRRQSPFCRLREMSPSVSSSANIITVEV